MPVPERSRTARVRVPEVYERGREHTSRLEVRVGTQLVAPDSGTFRLYSRDRALIASGAVTVAADNAVERTVSASSLPATRGYETGWSEEWELDYDGTVEIYRREACLARRALRCPITTQDLLVQQSMLLQQFGGDASRLDDLRDEAWAHTLRRLIQVGQWPELVVEPSALVDVVTYMTLTLCYRQLSAGAPSNERYAQLADTYHQQHETGWSRVRYHRDRDQDGAPDDGSLAGAQIGTLTRSTAPPASIRGRRLLRGLG